VAGVTANAFTLAATNTVSGSVQSVTGSGSDYTVTVSSLDGQGTVALSLVGGAITDLAGNAAVLKESDSHAVSGTTQPTTIEVSTTTSGLLGTGSDPSLSASGRLVAFTSLDAEELTTGPATDGVANVVVRDTLLGVTTLVSVDLDGKAANGSSGGASIDANGTEIAFVSDSTNLVDGGTTPGQANVYLATLTEGASGPTVKHITLVSDGNDQESEGTNVDGSEAFNAPIISADGSTVAFDSTQALVAGAESGVENVYSYNVATEKLTLVSGGTGENEYGIGMMLDPASGEYYEVLVPDPDKTPGTGGDFNSDVTSVSSDGKLIAYESTATDLGGPDVEPIDNVLVPSRGYIYNAVTGTTNYLDGTGTVGPSDGLDTAAYNVYDPVLVADGSASASASTRSETTTRWMRACWPRRRPAAASPSPARPTRRAARWSRCSCSVPRPTPTRSTARSSSAPSTAPATGRRPCPSRCSNRRTATTRWRCRSARLPATPSFRCATSSWIPRRPLRRTRRSSTPARTPAWRVTVRQRIRTRRR
jgi:hypothetical protein